MLEFCDCDGRHALDLGDCDGRRALDLGEFCFVLEFCDGRLALEFCDGRLVLEFCDGLALDNIRAGLGVGGGHDAQSVHDAQDLELTDQSPGGC